MKSRTHAPAVRMTGGGISVQLRRYRTYYLFLLPAVVVVFVFSYIPMFGVIMAFQDFSIAEGYLGSEFVGLRHFSRFLQSGEFFLSLRNTLGMNAIFLLVGFPLPIILALMLNEVKTSAFKRTIQSISYLPHFVSWVVVAGLAYKLLEPHTGLAGQISRLLGAEPTAFLRDADAFWTIMVTSTVWKTIGWNSIIFLAALTAIDPQLYEAAIVDGANRWQRLLHITLPSLAPVAGLMFLFTVARVFGGAGGGAGVAGINFDAIYNMANPLVMNRGLTVEYHIYLEGVRGARFAYAAAVGLALSTVSFVILLVTNRVSRKLSGWGAF